MALPVTFSAPGTKHEPSVEDALQFALWLALRADNVNAEYYSYDPTNRAAGVRIVMDDEHLDNEGRLILPQQIVQIGYSNREFVYNLNGGGTKTIEAVIIHVEKKSSEFVTENTAPIQDVKKTGSMLLARTEQILMRGTLFAPGQLTYDAQLVDYFRSPRYTEENAPDPELVGAYIPESIWTLNTKAPKFRRGMNDWKLRQMKKLADYYDQLDLSVDLGLAFFTFATYEVKIPDREDMTRGGFQNG